MINRTLTAVLVSFIVVVALPNTAIAEEQPPQQIKRPVLLTDRSRIQVPGVPQISPDGRNIVFELDGRIYQLAATTSSLLPISTASSNAWNPRWSADGQAIIFNSDRSGTNQIWKLSFDRPGEAEQVTKLSIGIAAGKLSPDESLVLLAFSDDELSDNSSSKPVPFVIDRRQFKRDAGEGYVTAGQVEHLYRYDTTSGLLHRLTSGVFAESEAAWSPDGTTVAFVSNRETDGDASYRTDIWMVAAKSDGQDTDLRRLTDDSRAKYAPSWSPDGTAVAYLASDDGVYGLQHLVIVSLTDASSKVLTAELDRWVTSFQFSADGKWIFFDYDDAGSRYLARVNVKSGKIDTLVNGDVNVSSFTASASGPLAIAMATGNDAGDVYRLANGKLQRLSELNDEYFAELQVGRKFLATFQSKDGTAVDAFITTPYDYEAGKQYPAILKIHGGPVDQFSWGYDFETQFLAANGYVVVEPNPRGSTGHGQEFIRAIYRSWGITDYDDVIAAIDFAIDKGYADPDQLAVTGYSYGGYMTNVVITNTTRFKAAATGAGHSLIAANVGHDMYQQWYSWELGVPWENRGLYDKLSPLLRAGNVTTPTLFLGGRDDWNVPILNAELFYQALKMKGVATRLVVYPDTHHGDWSDDFDNDYLQRLVTWFDHYVKSD